jgi:hypothetical protein
MGLLKHIKRKIFGEDHKKASGDEAAMQVSAQSWKAEIPDPAAVLRDQLQGQFIFPIDHREPGDIVIASYPKSGVNWLCHLILAAMYGFDAARIPSVVVANLVPDVHWAKFYQRTGQFTIFKSHLLPSPELKKVVLLYRDGRDSLVSYYHMLRNEGRDVNMMAMADGSFPLFPCGWGEFLTAWEKNPYGAEILPLRYEDLLTNSVEAFASFCKFCGITASPDQQAQALRQAAFQNLQEKEIREKAHKNISQIKEGLFYRKGGIGNYREEMPAEMLTIFESRYGEELVKRGYALSQTA